MKFFFDRNISNHLANMLNAFDRRNQIVRQDDDRRFEQDSDDAHIIRALASEDPKPIWVTNDISQKKVPAERLALRESEMTIFFVRRNYHLPHHQALKLLAVWPTVIDFAEFVREPTAFMISSGQLAKSGIGRKVDKLCLTKDICL